MPLKRASVAGRHAGAGAGSAGPRHRSPCPPGSAGRRRSGETSAAPAVPRQGPSPPGWTRLWAADRGRGGAEGGEQTIAQQAGELRHGVGLALAEGRAFAARPEAAARGATTRRRPSSLSSRQTSRSISRGGSPNSREWIRRTRSKLRSGKGSWVSSASSVRPRAPAGQGSAPCPAGMAAMVQSTSARKAPTWGVASPNPRRRRPRRSSPSAQLLADELARSLFQGRSIECAQLDDVVPHRSTMP